MIGSDSGRTPPPFSPAVAELLAYERDIVPQPEMMHARALARARAAVQEMDAVGVTRYRPPLPIRRILVAAAASVVFLAGGAAAYQMLRQPKLAPPLSAGDLGRSPRRSLTPAPEPVPQAAPLPIASGRPAASGRESTSSRRPAFASRRDAPPEELRLLVRARQADARGDYLTVLAVLAEHERNHPAGRLAEEREVLRVKALVSLGRAGEARQTAAKFRRRFPRSVLLHKIDDMLASLR